MPWQYFSAHDEWTKKLTRLGFDVVGACGYGAPDARKRKLSPLRNVRQWVDCVNNANAAGVILTKWIKCSAKNKSELLRAIRDSGKVMATLG
jgi:hypothetical protein